MSDFFAVDFDELTGLFGAAEVKVVQLFQEFVRVVELGAFGSLEDAHRARIKRDRKKGKVRLA